MGEKSLTVRDRIIVHLSGYKRYADEFECPEEMCQSGISTSTGKSRAHITLELNRMKEAGLVYERNARIKGAKSKRKTYLLTPSGLARNSEISKHLDSLKIKIVDGGATNTTGGADAVEFLRTKFGMQKIIAVDRVIESGGVLEMSRLDGADTKPDASKSHMPPRQENYLPRKELNDIITVLGRKDPNTLMLLGIPGMGKTMVLSQLAWTQSPDVAILYRKLYPFDSPATVMNTLADFMGSNGHPRLKRLLANAQPIDYPEAGIHVSDFLSQRKALVMFDDYECAPSNLDPLFSLLMELVRDSGSCMLIASAGKGNFYTLGNIALEGNVHEIKMGPMDMDCSKKLLGPGRDLDDKLKIAAGHPLTLKLLATGMTPGSLAGYVEDDILKKNSDLSKLCRFTAILRKPFMPEDLELFGFKNASDIRGNLAFEAQPGGGYLVHSAISSIMLASTGKRMLKELHSKAAEFHLQVNSDSHETLYHLIQANRIGDARSFILANRNALIESTNLDELAAMLELVLREGCESAELMEIASEVLDKAGKWEAAKNLAAEVERYEPGTQIAARSGILRANILAKTGNLDEALTVLESLRKAAEDSDIDAKFNHAEACVLRRMGRNREALKACKKAATMAKKGNDVSLHAQCQMESAMIMTASGQHSDALELLDKVGKDFERLGSAPDIIRCDINLGVVLRGLGRQKDAIRALDRAILAAEESGLNRLKAHALANLTDLLNRKGEFERSASLAENSIRIFSGLGEPLMEAAAMLNLCCALAGSGHKETAISVMNEAIAILKKNKLLGTRDSWPTECADMLRSIGEKKMATDMLRMCKDSG